MSYARIGNGLYAKTGDRKSLLDQYRENQKNCPHQQRDPRGTCYKCGDRKEVK